MNKYKNIIIGVILILYICIVNYISSTRIAFSLPIIILGILLIIYDLLKKRIKAKEFLHRPIKIIKIFLCIGLIVFLGIEAAIICYSKHNKDNTDYVLILGAGLANRKTPSYILQGRLDAALDYLQNDNKVNIILSGGQGDDEDLPESHAMSVYLQERGIDKERIIIEDKSRDTNENFKYSKEKIEENSKKSINEVSVKIITTDFHALRSSILAKKNGYIQYNNYSSPTVWYLIPITYTREAFAIVKSILFD